VRVLRIVVPAAVVFVVGLVALATWLAPGDTVDEPPDVSGTLTLSGTKLVMDLPHITGHTREGRPYELTARSAEQDLTRPEHLELKEVAAKVEQQDDAVLDVSAAKGLYDTKSAQLRVLDTVVLKSSSGYEAYLTEALIEMRTGHVVSDEPADVRLLHGVLHAGRLDAANWGELLRFGGGVATTYRLGRGASSGGGGGSRPERPVASPPGPERPELRLPADAIGRAGATPTPMQAGPPNALQGFSQNRDRPLQIDSTDLEVRDKDKIATFSGNVHLTQGDTTLTCDALTVYYGDPSGSAATKAGKPPSRREEQIRRADATGGVRVSQKDQIATGKTAVFDVKTDTWTLDGDVVVTQGKQVARGERLIVDAATGVSRLEGGRVHGLFMPSKQQRGRGPAAEGKEPQKPAAPLPLRPN
jgi:lipopolysaccharide export system protein LptA